MLGTWSKAPLMLVPFLAVAQVKSWPRGKDAHSLLGVQNRRGLFSLLSFNLQQTECLPQSNYLLPPGSCLDGLLALFQTGFPNINICQELSQSQGCKIRRKSKGSSGSQGRDRRQTLEEAGSGWGAEARIGQCPGLGAGDKAAKVKVWIYTMTVATNFFSETTY